MEKEKDEFSETFYSTLQTQIVDRNQDDEYTRDYFRFHSVRELISISLEGYAHLRQRIVLGAMYPWFNIDALPNFIFTSFAWTLGTKFQNYSRQRVFKHPIPMNSLHPPESLPLYWEICRLHFDTSCFKLIKLKDSVIELVDQLMQTWSAYWFRDLTCITLAYFHS